MGHQDRAAVGHETGWQYSHTASKSREATRKVHSGHAGVSAAHLLQGLNQRDHLEHLCLHAVGKPASAKYRFRGAEANTDRNIAVKAHPLPLKQCQNRAPWAHAEKVALVSCSLSMTMFQQMASTVVSTWRDQQVPWTHLCVRPVVGCRCTHLFVFLKCNIQTRGSQNEEHWTCNVAGRAPRRTARHGSNMERTSRYCSARGRVTTSVFDTLSHRSAPHSQGVVAEWPQCRCILLLQR
jgi:hypothetical protein